MEWLNNLTNGEYGAPVNLLLITLIILFIVIIITWVFRKITGTVKKRAMRSRVPRLSVTDSTMVDEKRYLVMVRRDNVEHLLLIGGFNDVVVESNIMRLQTSQKQPVAKEKASTIQKSNEQVPDAESTPKITTPLAGAATAGLASAAAVAATTTSTATEAVADASNFVESKAVDAAEVVSDVISDTTSTITETGSNALETAKEVLSTNVSAEVEDTIDAPTLTEEVRPTAIEEVELPEMDLESEISNKLDEALSIEPLEVNGETSSSNEEASTGNGDDEMQRLLDELSGKSKEPA